MFKKLKAIRNHKIFKDFVFLLFKWDTYKNHKTKKEVMPIDIDYYEGPLLLTHILYQFCFSVYIVTYVTIKYGFYYFVFEFGKKDLGYIIKEIGLAFGTCRLPFVVFAINMIDYAIDGYEFIKYKEYKTFPFLDHFMYYFTFRPRHVKGVKVIRAKLRRYGGIKKRYYGRKFKKIWFIYFYQYSCVVKLECSFSLLF